MSIRETVQHATKDAPQHSRIVKEASHLAIGTPRRRDSLNAYDSEIEDAYKALEESNHWEEIQPPTSWDHPGVYRFISEAVNESLGFKANDDDDIFRIGAD
ncbi:hypothetical protein V5O48_018471, partial [Marasmius crinis-equi]